MYKPDINGAVNRGSGNRIDFEEIKRRHPLAGYCESRGIHLKRQSGNLVGLCPFHNEDTPSFTVYTDDNHYHCYGCGAHGDVIDLERHRGGGEKIDAARRLMGGEVPTTHKPRPKEDDKKAHEPYKMSADELKRCQEASARLAMNPDVLASWRNWKRETIEGLAGEGVLGLWDKGKPAFLFNTGAKVRTFVIGEDKKVWWEFGKPSLWRAKLITNATQRIIITEGEIDAITLIDSGIEGDGVTRVVALSSVTRDVGHELDLFKGKEVVIVSDNSYDTWAEAPEAKFLKKNTELLEPVASKVHWMNLDPGDRNIEIKDLTELRDALGGLTVAEIEKRFFRMDHWEERIGRWAMRQFGENPFEVYSTGRLGCKNGQWTGLDDPDIPQRAAIEYGLIYDASSSSFWQTNASDQWIKVSESQAKRSLLHASKVQKEHIDGVLNQIVTCQCVHFTGALAGYRTGVYDLGAHGRMLVTNAPHFIDPEKGGCDTILTLLRQQFGAEQLPYLLGWLKVAIRSAKTHKYMPGQALGLFGGPGTGKTFIQDHLITPLLGGRDAKPYQFMCGKTDFNADLFAGEHLVISDENAHTDLASRRNFGTKIKDLCVNHRQKLHEKCKTGFMVAPFWRLSISANDEPENLMIMPPIDGSIADKVMLFKIDMPECLPDDEQREEFAAQIKSELPAFVGYLGRFTIPNELRSARYGVTHFHHSEILEAIEQESPERRLLGLIDIEVWKHNDVGDIWKGISTDLYQLLTREGSRVERDARQLLHHAGTCGKYLARLDSNTRLSRVQSYKSQGRRIFIIHKPTAARMSDESE
jgi:hypothetical protein